ncbi:hypothetical protein [Actinacidiphila glaucinigra]|uniref:hypothetical protein n=1 Tax=Actinacidiphila glaucinigra TaxID=235986 RepID=UPI0035E16A9F
MRGGAARAAQRRESGRRPDAPDAGKAATGTAAGTWLVLGTDGRLTAYAPCQGGLLRWTETAAGGDGWSGPDFFAAPGLTHLSIAQGGDGFVHFLGRRERPRADGRVAVDVVYALQYQSGRPLTEWVPVGNPHKEPERAGLLGVPVGAVDTSGAVHVFVRNAGGGVMLRREGKDGRWEPWSDLQGSQVQDGLAPTAMSSGHVELLASTGTSALRWIQPEAGGVMRRTPDVRSAPVPGSVAALETAPGRLTYYWADAGSGLVAYRAGNWAIPLGGDPAGDAVAVVRTALDGYDCTVLAYRDVEGRVMLAACGTENEAAGVWWSPAAERSVGCPGLALDVYGRVVLATIGADGALYISRQRAEQGLAMGPSARV